MKTKRGWLSDKIRDPEFQRLCAREDLIEDFLSAVEAAMLKKKITRADLARRLKCSPQNVTQLFRRTSNLTAATMADIAFHLGLTLKLKAVPA